HILMAKLEDDFWFACREARFVGDALAQDKGIVVEPEVGGIQEHDFPDCGLEDYAFIRKSNAKFVRRLCHELSIVKKDFRGRKRVWLEDQLTLEILNLIEWMAVTVMSLFAVGNGSGLRSLR